MSDSVQMPALGESVTEGTVTRWLKQVGEHVDVDEPLLEVSTDKVDTEIPSPVAGVLQEILVSEDETVAVGTALAKIGDGATGGDGNGAASQADVDGGGAPAEAPRTEPSADRVQAESTVPTPDVDAPPVRPSSTEVEEPAERPHPSAQPAGDGERVQMPALGESVTEGTVTRWLKHEGDSVEIDEPLLEVSTDKVDTEIPSPVAGVIRSILVGEDETVAVGADLVVVAPAGSGPAPAQAPSAQPAPAAGPGTRPCTCPRSPGTSRSPSARRPGGRPGPRRTPGRGGRRRGGLPRPGAAAAVGPRVGSGGGAGGGRHARAGAARPAAGPAAEPAAEPAPSGRPGRQLHLRHPAGAPPRRRARRRPGRRHGHRRRWPRPQAGRARRREGTGLGGRCGAGAVRLRGSRPQPRLPQPSRRCAARPRR